MDSFQKSFKERRTFGQRVSEAEKTRKNFPNKIPVIIERYRNENQLPPLDRSKFLIPEHLKVGEVHEFEQILIFDFLNIKIRRRLQLNSVQTIFLLVNHKSLPATSSTFAEIYRTDSDPDGFLYIVYASHEVYGADEDKE